MKSKTERLFITGIRTLGRLILTGFVFAGAGGAIFAGSSVLAARGADDIGVEAAPPTTVQAQPLVFETSFTVERRFTGAFEARQETALGFEEGGLVVEVLVEEGDTVDAGAVLARLDTRLLQQERERLQAARIGLDADAERARRANGRQQELRSRGFATDERVDETSLGLVRLEAAIAETEAAIASVDIRLEKTDLIAPFDGRIGARLLDEGAVVAPGTPLLTVLQNGVRRFRVGLAPDLAAALDDGAAAELVVGGARIPAALTRIAPELDPATRSQLAYFTPEAGHSAPAGATGEVRLTDTVTVARPGVWVPLTALRQGPRGSWTVLTLDQDADAATVGLVAVEILHLGTGRAFVRGAFQPDALIVNDGSHRVVPGERVISVEVEAVSWTR